MTDQQPENPAARAPENATPTRIDGAPTPPDPTRIDHGSATPDPTRSAARPVEPTRIEDAPTAAGDRQKTPEPTPTPSAPDPTRIEHAPDPAGAEAAPAEEPVTATDQPGTGTAPEAPEPPARWSGSAVVPPHVPKRPWWSRRRTDVAADQPAPPADPWADSEDWSATPAVDPWADQDTPWQAELPFPEAMPPTRIESAMPPTGMAALPPTRMEAPLPPPPGTRAPLPQAQADALLRRAKAQPQGPAPAPPQPARTQPAPAPPPRAPASPPAAPAAAGGPAAPTSPPRRRGWGRKKRARQAAAQEQAAANRLPVQPRPPAPPPWAPQARPPQGRPPQYRPLPAQSDRRPPPPPRRKRRWPRRLFLFTLFSVVCCCGVPAYLAWPAARQYPVSAALPQTVADLDLREDAAGRRAVERLSEQLSGTSLVQGEVFAGVYADGAGKRVTIFGTTGLRFTPESDVEAEIAHLAGEYDITDVQSYDLGESGVHERCGVGRSSGKTVVVCAWADHGSLATVLLTRRSVPESAELTGVLRSAVLTRG